jgi:hypothetical protein
MARRVDVSFRKKAENSRLKSRALNGCTGSNRPPSRLPASTQRAEKIYLRIRQSGIGSGEVRFGLGKSSFGIKHG